MHVHVHGLAGRWFAHVHTFRHRHRHRHRCRCRPALSERLFGSKAVKLPHVHHDGLHINVTVQAWHVQAICTIYSQDFACFGYEKPAMCV